MELSFNCQLNMRSSGKTDVFDPAINLMKYAVPSEDTTLGLIPPGPSIAQALKSLTTQISKNTDSGLLDEVSKLISTTEESLEKRNGESDGDMELKIGNYLNLTSVILTKATPLWSSTLDNKGFPISCKLQIDVRTSDIVTKQMLNGLANTGGL